MKRWIALLLVLVLTAALAGNGIAAFAENTAGAEPEPAEEATPEAAEDAAPEPTPEPYSAFVEQGLADQVVSLTEAEGQTFDYHYLYYSVGGDYMFTVTPFWLSVPALEESEPFMYVPEDAMPKTSNNSMIVDLAQAINGMLKNPEEYEWRGAFVSMDWSSASKWGLYHDLENYYDSELWDESRVKKYVGNQMPYWTHKLMYQDTEYTAYEINLYVPSSSTVQVYKLCCVPKGFDGLVYVMYNDEHPFKDGIIPKGHHFYDYINDETMYFRLA